MKLTLFILAVVASDLALDQKKAFNQRDMEESLQRVFKEYQNDSSTHPRSIFGFPYPSSPKPAAKMGTVEDAKFFIRYASVIHCPKDNQLNWTCENCVGNTNGTSNVVYFEDIQISSNGYLALNHNKKLIIISYIGTVDMYSWIYDFKMFLVSAEITGQYSKARVHSGFKEMANKLYPQSETAFKNAYSTYSDYRVIFAAHSIGGPIATLVAAKFAENKLIPWDKITLITYEQPRIGDLELTRYFNSKPWTVTRVTNYGDVLPNLPHTELGFAQNQYNMHIGKDGNVVPCSNTSEDYKCTSDFLIPIISAHNIIWGQDFNTRCNPLK